MSHVGIRVRDFERSLRFYHDALGFRFVAEERIPEPLAQRLYGAKREVRVGWLEREGVRIQLLELPEPGAATAAAREPSPFARFGPTHLALRVADLDAALRELGALGIPVLEGTRAESAERNLRLAFVSDPDGAWIELAEQAGD